MRYDAALDAAWLEQLGRKIDPSEAIRLQSMDDLEIIDTLYDIGCRAAEEEIKPEHLFGDALPLKSASAP